MASDDIWYYTRGGERIGPVTELELSNIVARGDLRPEELVWKEGMEQWVQLRFAEGLPELPPPDSESSFTPEPAPVPSPAPASAVAPTYQSPYSMPAAPAPIGYASPMHPAVTYASFGQRFVAALIDNVILTVLRFGCILPFGMIGAMLDDTQGASDSRDMLLGFLLLATWVLVGWLYCAILEASRWQGTLGKRAMSLKVADLTGQRASFIQTSVRHFLKIVSAAMFGIGYLMAAFTERRQALHDLAANTIILYERHTITPIHYQPEPLSARLS